MSQKIIIPKGTIDSAHTTIIEIPNYLHETSTVVVTTPKTADSEFEEHWEGNEYEENNPEQIEENWEQDYEPQEMTNEIGYPLEQQEGYQYTTEEIEPNVGHAENRNVYIEEQSIPQRSNEQQHTENMMRRMLDKKRELARLKSERQRLLEGEAGTYEAPPQIEDNVLNLSEVPESMRGKPTQREFEMERRRRQMESQRYQSRSAARQAAYRAGYPQRDPSASKYTVDMQNRNLPNNRPMVPQVNPDVHGYPDAQYVRQGQPRAQYVQGQMRRPMPQQVMMSPEEMRQYQKARRRAMFNVPKN